MIPSNFLQPIGEYFLFVIFPSLIGLIFLLYLIFSKKFRGFVKQKKLPKILFISFVVFPIFYWLYGQYRHSLLENERDEYRIRYTLLKKEENINGRIYPKGTKFHNWWIHKGKILYSASFPEPYLYHGLWIDKIFSPMKMRLTKPQVIGGLLCTNLNKSLDYIRINLIKKNVALKKCQLADTVTDIIGINLPKDHNLWVGRRTKTEWFLSSTYSSYYVNQVLYGVEFRSYYLTIDLDKKEVLSFSGFLAKDVIINGEKYKKGSYIKDAMLDLIKKKIN